jgi:hypothetical protein
MDAAFDRWCGLRVVAADGTCLRLAPWRENVDAYGLGPCRDGSVVMTRCVALFATASRQLLDITVGRYDAGEREVLLGCLDALNADDVLVLDRGYPAWWLFAALHAKAKSFCARVEGCSWPQVEQFMKSTQRDATIERELSAQTRAKLAELGLDAAQVSPVTRVRLIKVVLPNGRLEVLVTSLLDGSRFPAEMFGQLYRSRWGVEEAFKSLKHRLDLEGFSGELPQSVEQEIHAKALMYNITQALCTQASERLQGQKQATYQVNHAYALTHATRVIACWLRGVPGELAALAEQVIAAITKTLEQRRPGRSFPRNHKIGGAQTPRRSYR